jgi:hypothetical protein
MISNQRLLRYVRWAQRNLQVRLYTSGIWSTSHLYLPQFLGIGAQKAGSTWLHENLSQHPDLYLPPLKELHYFNDNFHRSLRSYSNYFEPGLDKIKGEVTPGYSVIPLDRVYYIRCIMPDVKIIFLMRNPIDRAWSHALMGLVSRPRRKYEDVAQSEFYDHFTSARSIARGDYRRILDRWMSVFPRKQIYIGFFDDISNRPKELLLELFEFIGVKPVLDWSMFPYNTSVNEGVKVPMPEQYRDFLEQLYCQEIECLYARFGDRVAHWRCAKV